MARKRQSEIENSGTTIDLAKSIGFSPIGHDVAIKDMLIG